MKTVYVFLADGFEEIEAITPIDFLRRAGIEVVTVGVTGKTVTGAHNISILADISGEGFALPPSAAMVLLPGGGPGTENLKKSPMVAQMLQAASSGESYITAICAAPTVLHEQGLIEGKTVTAFPSVQKELSQSRVTGRAVEIDGNIVTARSAGVALQFAHTLAGLLAGPEKADEVLHSLYPGA